MNCFDSVNKNGGNFTLSQGKKGLTILVGKNRSSLLFVEFPDVFSRVSRFSFIRSFKASRLRQTANVIEFVPRDQVFHLLIVYLTKIGKFTQILSITIALSCFYLLISHLENFSTWISRLPFAVNAVLNLFIVSCRNPANSSQHYSHCEPYQTIVFEKKIETTVTVL